MAGVFGIVSSVFGFLNTIAARASELHRRHKIFKENLPRWQKLKDSYVSVREDYFKAHQQFRDAGEILPNATSAILESQIEAAKRELLEGKVILEKLEKHFSSPQATPGSESSNCDSSLRQSSQAKKAAISQFVFAKSANELMDKLDTGLSSVRNILIQTTSFVALYLVTSERFSSNFEGYERALVELRTGIVYMVPTWSPAPTLHIPLQRGPYSYRAHGTGFEQSANPSMTVPYGAQASYTSNFQQTGRRRALLIGIKYLGMGAQMELHGCANDVKNMHYLLRTKFGFQDGDFRVLSDAQRDMGLNVAIGEPTTKSILENMRWLVKDARPGDSLFFHFSGYGTQVPDFSGGELDAFVRAIFPIDYEKNGLIFDDTIHDVIARRLPKGVRLTAVFDCTRRGMIKELTFFHDDVGFGSGIIISRPLGTQSASAFEHIILISGRLNLSANVVRVLRKQKKDLQGVPG